MLKHIISSLLLLCSLLPAAAQRSLTSLWKNPTRDYRMKTWWFFGYENTTKEGITADVEALKKAGFGGVVYYDQDHRGKDIPNGAATPDEGFSPLWWQHLKWAAKEAQRVGLTFEVNISNGYVAGGRWIDSAHAMQRVASAKTTVEGGRRIDIPLPSIHGSGGYVKDIAVLAFPAVGATHNGDTAPQVMRHFTAHYKAEGKGRNGAMQKPGKKGDFSGYGWRQMPDIGMLQVSDDSTAWRDVIKIEPMYSSQGGYFYRTNAFPATKGRYWRVNYSGKELLREWSVGPEAKLDRWEERAALHSDFAEDSRTPSYSHEEVIDPSSIIDLTDCIIDGRLQWNAPQGSWTILRLSAVLTGAKSKHGRKNLLGYECDKLSKEAARLQWDSYVQVILDSLGTDGNVSGITMDSHEGGAQNWTPLMLQEFKKRRGYDLSPYLPMLAGYVMQTTELTKRVLTDYRQTVADCIRDNYYGTFQQLATERGLTFTAQAIGNALCIDGDAISVKKAVGIPQGEFWTYQRDGAYDVKDCSSACHLYGKPIASAEALTDTEYKDSANDLFRFCNIAFSFGAQEFVVCATPHIPWVKRPGTMANGKGYVAGREYAINRSNLKWSSFFPVWEQAARSMVMLRQGKAAPDALVYLGDDIPMKILTSRLPDGLEHLDWDACTGDALQLMTAADGKCRNASLSSPIDYKAIIIAHKAFISPDSQVRLDSLKQSGVQILTDGSSIVRPLKIMDGNDSDIVHTHRIINIDGKEQDLFYIASIANAPTTIGVVFKGMTSVRTAQIWYNRTGSRRTISPDGKGIFHISLAAGESIELIIERSEKREH